MDIHKMSHFLCDCNALMRLNFSMVRELTFMTSTDSTLEGGREVLEKKKQVTKSRNVKRVQRGVDERVSSHLTTSLMEGP